MISLQTLTGPPTAPDPVLGLGADAFFALLRLIGHPEAAKERLQKIYDAVTEANEEIRAANEAKAAIDAERKAHDEALKRERADHDRELTNAKAKSDDDCTKAMSEVREHRDNATKHEASAKADAAVAADLRADLEQRLAKIRSAAA